MKRANKKIMYLPPKKEIPEQIEDAPKKASPWLVVLAVILVIITLIFLGLVILKFFKIDFDPWEKIISWENIFNNSTTNNSSDNNGQNLNTNPLPEASGPGGLVTLNLSNNVSVTLPDSYSLYSGWQEKIDLTFTNNNNISQTVNLKFQGLPYTYLNDKTPSYDNYLNQIIDLETVNLNPNETKSLALTIQTAKVWDNYFTLYLNEKEQKINLNVTIKDKTPIFGNDNSACAGNQPYLPYYGPNCGPCANNGLSTNRDCIISAKQSGSNSCYPYKFEYYPQKEDDLINQCQQALKFNSQIDRNAPIGWGIMIDENTYAWERADWYIDAVSNKVKANQGLPSGIMGGDGGWATTCSECTNPDGSKGLFDMDNTFLVNKFRQLVFDISARYQDKIKYYEMANEPAAEYYLCSCDLKNASSFAYIPSNTPDCNATSGPNQPACNGYGFGHNYKQEFADTYGELLAGTVKIASEELKKNYAQGWIVTGAIDDQPAGLTPATEYMISSGILDNNNVAIGIHQYPHNGLTQFWSSAPVNCSYYQKPDDYVWLPEECEKAPTFSGLQTANKNLTISQIWQDMDRRYDASQLLKDAQTLGVLDKIYFFDSELHAGFSNPQPKYDLTEAITGFRIGTINAHQKFLGTIYILAATNDFSAKVFNEMTKILTGVTPYYNWESKLIDSDYSAVVYKLFTRGNEDILVFWNNDDQTKNVNLQTNNTLTNTSSYEIISLDADRGTSNFIQIIKPNSLLTSFNLKTAKEIKVISVMRQEGSQSFEWLNGISY